MKKKSGRPVLGVIVIKMLLAATAIALDPNPKDPVLLNNLHEARVKQEDHENVVRVIQQPIQMMQGNLCQPIEMARQRIRDLGSSKKWGDGTINVEAGHGEINVESNAGTINNSVNVQMVTQNDRRCF
ncbi:MAG: hypothetical protein HYW02_06425 [Deltaproteobacteria bacterium]|nr:hypothetical protein [Deltaproteobacteria bacterium]MBI2501086.1 hypothetical protein [Deltaproteobacteria bacterium]